MTFSETNGHPGVDTELADFERRFAQHRAEFELLKNRRIQIEANISAEGATDSELDELVQIKQSAWQLALSLKKLYPNHHMDTAGQSLRHDIFVSMHEVEKRVQDEVAGAFNRAGYGVKNSGDADQEVDRAPEGWRAALESLERDFGDIKLTAQTGALSEDDIAYLRSIKSDAHNIWIQISRFNNKSADGVGDAELEKQAATLKNNVDALLMDPDGSSLPPAEQEVPATSPEHLSRLQIAEEATAGFISNFRGKSREFITKLAPKIRGAMAIGYEQAKIYGQTIVESPLDFITGVGKGDRLSKSVSRAAVGFVAREGIYYAAGLAGGPIVGPTIAAGLGAGFEGLRQSRLEDMRLRSVDTYRSLLTGIDSLSNEEKTKRYIAVKSAIDKKKRVDETDPELANLRQELQTLEVLVNEQTWLQQDGLERLGSLVELLNKADDAAKGPLDYGLNKQIQQLEKEYKLTKTGVGKAALKGAGIGAGTALGGHLLFHLLSGQVLTAVGSLAGGYIGGRKTWKYTEKDAAAFSELLSNDKANAKLKPVQLAERNIAIRSALERGKVKGSGEELQQLREALETQLSNIEFGDEDNEDVSLELQNIIVAADSADREALLKDPTNKKLLAELEHDYINKKRYQKTALGVITGVVIGGLAGTMADRVMQALHNFGHHPEVPKAHVEADIKTGSMATAQYTPSPSSAEAAAQSHVDTSPSPSPTVESSPAQPDASPDASPTLAPANPTPTNTPSTLETNSPSSTPSPSPEVSPSPSPEAIATPTSTPHIESNSGAGSAASPSPSASPEASASPSPEAIATPTPKPEITNVDPNTVTVEVPNTTGQPESVQMQKTIWHSVKHYYEEQLGIKNPSNELINKATDEIAKLNQVDIIDHPDDPNIDYSVTDRAMAKGFELHHMDKLREIAEHDGYQFNGSNVDAPPADVTADTPTHPSSSASPSPSPEASPSPTTNTTAEASPSPSPATEASPSPSPNPTEAASASPKTGPESTPPAQPTPKVELGTDVAPTPNAAQGAPTPTPTPSPSPEQTPGLRPKKESGSWFSTPALVGLALAGAGVGIAAYKYNQREHAIKRQRQELEEAEAAETTPAAIGPAPIPALDTPDLAPTPPAPTPELTPVAGPAAITPEAEPPAPDIRTAAEIREEIKSEAAAKGFPVDDEDRFNAFVDIVHPQSSQLKNAFEKYSLTKKDVDKIRKQLRKINWNDASKTKGLREIYRTVLERLANPPTESGEGHQDRITRLMNTIFKMAPSKETHRLERSIYEENGLTPPERKKYFKK